MSGRRGDDGQTSLLLIPAVAGLLAAVLLVITMLGDGVQKRTQTRTSADAAALAAAEAWREAVDDLYEQALEGSFPARVRLLHALLDGDPTDLDGGAARSQAERFASSNGAELTGFDVRVGPRGVEYLATTRSLTDVHDTQTKPEARAVARAEPRSGLCADGGRLGIVVGGHCLTGSGAFPTPEATPTSTPTGTPSGTATPTPTPTPTPTLDLEPLRWRVGLVE
ncbi:hypothetical protein ACPPVT_18475 [Angustibacter sp. McL0619]|uniref:hypothetical protein n=1 Tax=Angustibacter sp. McL0619 TaxID=3415676 RepID=UPI003CED4A13